MNIIKMELKLSRRELVIWISSLTILTVLTSLFYPSFKESIEPLKQMLQSFPKIVLDSMNFDISSFTSYPGFLSYIITYISIAISIYAMQLGQYITSREKTIGMSDFLITKPTNRTAVVGFKYMAAIIQLSVITIILLIISLLINALFTGMGINSIVYTYLSTLLTAYYFVALGAFISSLLPSNKNVLSISMVVVFIMVFITMMQRIFNDRFLEYISPFSQLDTSKIILFNGFHDKLLFINILSTIVLLFLATFFYNRQDFRK